MTLEDYRDKRDFGVTAEPKGGKKGGKDIFVVQEHHATRLHYDLRLSVGGVLKSWAVPKGIPEKTPEKHLAVETEDHPLEYAGFEGKVPKGQYGAGDVKIWDSGTYRNIRRKDMSQSYEEGQIEVNLKGGRLKGNYALIRTKFNDNPKNWLILKMKDDKYAFENG
jgi:bifunctional non-homologous end joining protein LigD